MGRLIALGLALFAILVVGSCSTERVTPGNVGVRVNQYGGGAGVSGTALGVGTYFTPPGTTIHEYPISTQNYTWAKSQDQNNPVNEEFAFQDRSGLIVAGDVSIAYHVDPAKAPILYQKYRMDMDGLIAGPLRNQVRSAIVNVASQMGVEDIYGPKKGELIARAQQQVQAFFRPSGLVIEQMYWAGPIRIPENILNQINAKIRNEQEALAAQANLATVEANAKSKIAQAQGEAEAQRLVAASIKSSPELIEKMWVEKWDGRMPQTVYCAAATPCIRTGK